MEDDTYADGAWVLKWKKLGEGLLIWLLRCVIGTPDIT